VPTAGPTIGLALIARDEQATLPRLLASVRGAFDEIALVDTGSRDRTVRVFEGWARRELEAGRLRRYAVDHFRWGDDFAAARNYADSLLPDTDWLCWADCDDEIEGAHNLRGLVTDAGPSLVAVLAFYDYYRDELDRCTEGTFRERLVRQGHGGWQGRVHEAQDPEGMLSPGGLLAAPPNVVRWVHHQDMSRNIQRAATRLRILRAWLRDEPENPRALRYLEADKGTLREVRAARRAAKGVATLQRRTAPERGRATCAR
jgi:glycosyltransferase involved in cell wall biosynthesis